MPGRQDRTGSWAYQVPWGVGSLIPCHGDVESFEAKHPSRLPPRDAEGLLRIGCAAFPLRSDAVKAVSIALSMFAALAAPGASAAAPVTTATGLLNQPTPTTPDDTQDGTTPCGLCYHTHQSRKRHNEIGESDALAGIMGVQENRRERHQDQGVKRNRTSHQHDYFPRIKYNVRSEFTILLTD